MKFYMDPSLKSNLMLARKALRNDWDFIALIDGVERGGKSVLGQQCAHVLDPSFCLKRMAFEGNGFKDAVLDAKQYQAIIFDEGLRGLSARRTMSNINTRLVQMLAEIGQRNLAVLVILPSFFDLDKNIALWRSRALLHIKTVGEFKRGMFAFYSGKRKKELYIKGKKMYDYSKVTPNFLGRYPNHYTINEAEYREAKRLAHAAASQEDQKSKQTVEHEQLVNIVAHMLEWNDRQPKDRQLQKKEMAELLGIHYGSLWRIIRETMQ